MRKNTDQRGDFQKSYTELKKNKHSQNIVFSHLESQKFAWSGFLSIFKEEPNFRIELVLGFVVILLGVFLDLSVSEMIVVTMVVSSVLFAEIVNSIVERLCDIYSSQHHVGIKFIKDVAAAGVLLMAINAIVIGSLIFLPQIRSLVG